MHVAIFSNIILHRSSVLLFFEEEGEGVWGGEANRTSALDIVCSSKQYEALLGRPPIVGRSGGLLFYRRAFLTIAIIPDYKICLRLSVCQSVSVCVRLWALDRFSPKLAQT